MLKTSIVRIVDYCTRHPWLIIVGWMLFAVIGGFYATANFGIDTDIGKLISPNLDWRKREIAFEAAFPGRFDSILVVVEAPTPELATAATNVLSERLSQDPELFRSVEQAGGGAFFERNGLLFLPTDEVERATQGLGRAEQLIATLTGDPSLRGISDALSLSLAGVQRGMLKLDDMVRPLTMAAGTVEDVLAGRRASFSWHVLLNGRPAEP